MDDGNRWRKAPSPAETRLGWIGVGVMGLAMAARLADAGYSIAIYARTPSKAAPLLHRHPSLVRLAASPADAARSSDVLFTMVGHPSDVRAVVLGDGGALSSLSPGGILVDCTSSSPALAREIAAAARAAGRWAVDAPVSGGDVGAREGRLAILAGGERAAVEWLRPVFGELGWATYMGPAGSGQICKIGNQIAGAANLVGLSEAAVFAEAAGLDVGRFVAAVGGGAAGTKVMELFGRRMVEGDFQPGGMAVYMVKDLGMAVDGGGVALPGAAMNKELFQAMVSNGDGKLGIQGVISVIKRLNGKC